MIERDILVASVAIILGSILIISAVFDSDMAFETPKGEYLAKSLGRTKARLVFGLVGSLLFAMGIHIVATPHLSRYFRPSTSNDTTENSRASEVWKKRFQIT